MVLGVERDVKVASSDRLGHGFIFTLGVDDNDVDIKHEAAENLKFGGIGFS